MIFPGIAFTNAVLHQSGQGRQDADGRVNGLAVKGPVQNDLAFGDISGKIRDRMGDIVAGHG